MKCSINDCGRKVHCRGWCNTHYQRWRTHGDPLIVKPSRWHPVETKCSIPDCGRPRWARGWCETHYRRWEKNGDPLILKRPTPGSLTPEQRFWAKVIKSGGCWIWNANTSRDGYGLFTVKRGDGMNAHRFAYQLRFGAIPDGMELDHACHNEDPACRAGRECLHRRCVNPDHLRLITGEEHRRTGWDDRRRRYDLR